MFRLRDASAYCYRFFDVADEIDLGTCRALLKSTTEPRALKLQREGSKYIQLSSPPIGVDIGERTLLTRAGPTQVHVSARVFHHGAISIVTRVPIAPGTTLGELVPFADELYDNDAIDALAADELSRLRTVLGAGMTGAHTWDAREEYTVLFARELDDQPTGAQVLGDPDLARLLIGERERLSPSETHEVLDQHFSYTDHDLAVVEWNAAFIYEPSGSQDVQDLLEIANAQLLELRYYDDVLDRELERVYDLIAAKKGGSIFYSPYKRLLRELMQTLIELSEFIERIENALKIVGDVYLARVYEAGVRQLRVAQWTEQVTRKHRLLQQTYALLKGEVDTDRSLTLEVMIVSLIVLEILMALLQVTGH